MFDDNEWQLALNFYWTLDHQNDARMFVYAGNMNY